MNNVPTIKHRELVLGESHATLILTDNPSYQDATACLELTLPAKNNPVRLQALVQLECLHAMLGIVIQEMLATVGSLEPVLAILSAEDRGFAHQVQQQLSGVHIDRPSYGQI